MYANFLSVLAAAIAAFLVGGFWYGPLFGKTWQREIGRGQINPSKPELLKLLGLTLLFELIAAFFLGHLLAHVARSTQSVMMISMGIALGFILPATIINYLYAGRSAKLMAIDGGHWVAVFAVMGAVFALIGV